MLIFNKKSCKNCREVLLFSEMSKEVIPMNLKIVVILSLFLPIYLFCSHPPQQIIQKNPNYEKQRLEILEKIQRSVVRVSCSAYYDNFYYAKPKENMTSLNLEELLIKKETTTNSVAGSSLIISRNARKDLLLTCYHLFDFQDTLKTYYSDIRGIPTNQILSLSIKKGQNIFIAHKNGKRNVSEIIAFDKKKDLALLETETIENLLIEEPFNGIFGKKGETKFGKEVYLIGFPKGFLCVTRGLISISPYKNKFMLDAPFNRGFSGGAVIAIDERRGACTYIGMANSIAYDSQLILTPEEKAVNLKYFENMPYKGDVFIKELKLVNVGLTFAIKSDLITSFLNEENENLRQKGFYLSVEFE